MVLQKKKNDNKEQPEILIYQTLYENNLITGKCVFNTRGYKVKLVTTIKWNVH